jgi:hypothetical protein
MLRGMVLGKPEVSQPPARLDGWVAGPVELLFE